MQITIVPEGNVGGIQQLNSKLKTRNEFCQRQETATVLKLGGIKAEEVQSIISYSFNKRLLHKSFGFNQKVLHRFLFIF